MRWLFHWFTRPRRSVDREWPGAMSVLYQDRGIVLVITPDAPGLHPYYVSLPYLDAVRLSRAIIGAAPVDVLLEDE